MVDELWEVEFFEDATGTEPVLDWLENQLSDPAREAAIAAIEEVLTPRGTQVCETEWGKNLGEGLYELRIRHSAEEIQRMFGSTLSGDEEQRHEQNEQEDGQHHEQAKEEEEDEEQRGEHDEDSDRRKGRPEVLLRVYFTTDGRKVVLLLAGYDKGRYGGGKREHRAIKTARKRVTEHREQQRRDKARRRKGR